MAKSYFFVSHFDSVIIVFRLHSLYGLGSDLCGLFIQLAIRRCMFGGNGIGS